MCRRSIVFDTVKEVAACLNAIAADEEVDVVRVKNRLDPAYDSKMSGGYRDVNLNLRLLNPVAAELGAAGHICEVQLLLRPFEQLKGDAGHRNYVMFRNLRVD